MKDAEKAAQQPASYTSIATQLPPQGNFSEILIPADGDCLYTTIFIGYLLPVINVKNDFISRLRKLIGPWSPLLENASQLRNCIINSFRNVSELKHPRFKEYILAFRKAMRLDDKKWGGPEEIKIIATNLGISIREHTENPDLNSQSSQHYISLDNTNPSNSMITINILRTTASENEILQSTDDLAMLKTKAESLDSSQNRQHYRLLLLSLNAATIPTLSPNENVQKPVSVSTTTSSGKAEEGLEESHSRFQINPHKETEVDDIDPLFRRYDSFAWLIQGNDECGAAYFDGTTLFLATNFNEQSAIYRHMIQYFRDIVIKSLNYKEIISQISEQERSQQIADFIDASVRDIADVILLANKLVTIFYDKEYVSNFIRSLFKVTFSIISSCLDKYFKEYVKSFNTEDGWLQLEGICNQAAQYVLKTIQSSRGYKYLKYVEIVEDLFSIRKWISPYMKDNQEAETLQQRAFSKKLVNAMNTKKIRYLQSDIAGVHAELKILEKIIEQYKILDKQNHIIKKKVKNLPQQYIGISKRCCLNCELTIKAVNNVLRRYGLNGDFISIRTKGGSRAKFMAAPPSFLEKQEDFKTEFLLLRRRKSLRQAFSETEKGIHIPGSRQNQRRSKTSSKSVHSGKNVTRKLRTVKTKRKDGKQIESIPIYGARRISRDKWQFYSTPFKDTSLISAPTLEKLQSILNSIPIESKSLNESTIEIRLLKTHQNSITIFEEIKTLLIDLPEVIKKAELSEETENFVLTIEATNPKWKESLEAVLTERQILMTSQLSIERI